MRGFVLKNALDFGGSVNPKAVLGLVLRSHPELKKDVPSVLKEIETVVKEVDGLSPEDIKEELEKVAPELLREVAPEKVKGPLKELPNATKGKVVVRIAPSPSGTLHIGHAYGASLNYEYAKMYGGKFILRIEDTNPENIYDKAYELIEEDAKWLTEDHVAEVVVQSERLGLYYDAAEALVAAGNAYVCECNADTWREMKNDGKACACRELEVKEQQVRYAKMFDEYVEGEAVLRLKTDIQHKNPAMRDFAIMRINQHVHPKTGKDNRVWPLMVLSVAVDDHDLGITHVLNGKDHTDNAKKEAMIMKMLGWGVPEYKHWGRINFEGFTISSSKTRIAIEQNEYTGWDDIRLPFMPALRRRGYQPEAFRKFATEIGLSLNDKSVTREEFWKMVNAFNKEIVEEKANRYFFVEKPIEVEIEWMPTKTVKLDLHPDFPKRGKRELGVGNKFYVARVDYEQLEERKIHRLIDCCNFIVEEGKCKFVSEEYIAYKDASNRGRIIHWLPVSTEVVDVEVMLENGSVAKGVGEKGLVELKEGTIVQLERCYFARVDHVEKDRVVLWYLHR